MRERLLPAIAAGASSERNVTGTRNASENITRGFDVLETARTEHQLQLLLSKCIR